MKARRGLPALFVLLLGACASGPQPPSYPAFVVTDELPDIFMAALPGIRGKQLAGNAQLRTTSNRIDLPPDWSGTTGGSPGKSLEIFVVSGQLRIADVVLKAGGYAYVPPGSLGFNLQTDGGARILYFLDDVDGRAVIRTPLILDSMLLEWQPTGTPGVSQKELRADPGSGARSWLQRIEPGAKLPWQSVSVTREGFLLSGQFQGSECVGGEAYTELYLPGGYFYRPAGAVHDGPAAQAMATSVWFLREQNASQTDRNARCLETVPAAAP